MELRKAQRSQAKLRIGVSSPAGGGKTYSALVMASGMAPWDKIAVIDTENGSGEMYSDLGEYNIIPLEAPFSPERYIEAIKACENAGMEIIIIDSISHEWGGVGGCLEINDALANAKYRGNSWSAWSETTPRHQNFIDAIISSSCHVITTVRNKIDTVMTEDKKVKKVGTKEMTREGFEYELTVNFNIDRDTHKVMASKDRTRLFEELDPFVITAKTGKALINWMKSGVKVEPKPEPEVVVTSDDVIDYLTQEGVKMDKMVDYIKETIDMDAKTADPAAMMKALQALKVKVPAKKKK